MWNTLIFLLAQMKYSCLYSIYHPRKVRSAQFLSNNILLLSVAQWYLKLQFLRLNNASIQPSGFFLLPSFPPPTFPWVSCFCQHGNGSALGAGGKLVRRFAPGTQTRFRRHHEGLRKQKHQEFKTQQVKQTDLLTPLCMSCHFNYLIYLILPTKILLHQLFCTCSCNS